MSLSPSRLPLDSQSSLRPIFRGKRFSLRRRIFLLVFLCVLWIYHGIGQRPKNSESGGRTPDHTERMFTIPAGDEASGRNPYPVLNGAQDSPHSRKVAAILPVTNSSLPRLSESLSALSTVPYLNEVHLLCPASIADAVRHSLRNTLSRTQGFGHTEFFVTLWQHELSVAESTLQVASDILSDSVLILPQEGLAGIDRTSQNILLFGSSPLPVPLGLRGSEVSCGIEFRGFLAARFVLPPLILPSRLGTADQSYFHLTSWQELGTYFAQTQGVGGVVPLEGTNTCRDRNTSEAVTLDFGDFNASPESSDDYAPLAILMAEIGDAPALFKLACEFELRGTKVKVIAYGLSSDSIHLTRDDCNVVVTHLDPQDSTLHQLFGRSWDVFLTLREYRFIPESLLEATPRKTVIRIPRRDLPHCDWMASLGIRELRSKTPSSTTLGVLTDFRLAPPQGRDICHNKR